MSLSAVEDHRQLAYSDIIGNTKRGALAEFIVAQAVGSTAEVRDAWAAYGLETPAGIRVEVKSSGYSQSWYQKRLSRPGVRHPKVAGVATRIWRIRWRESPAMGCLRVLLTCVPGGQDAAEPPGLGSMGVLRGGEERNRRAFGERKCLLLPQVRELSGAHAVDEIAEAVERAFGSRSSRIYGSWCMQVYAYERGSQVLSSRWGPAHRLRKPATMFSTFRPISSSVYDRLMPKATNPKNVHSVQNISI